MAKYTYSVSEDTLNGKVSIDALTSQIGASTIHTAIDRLEATGDVLDCYFKEDLGESEQVTLTAVIAAHDGEPLVPPSETILTLPSNAFQMQADAVTAEIPKGTTGTIDFKIQNFDGESYETKYLAGAEIYTANAALGDWAESQIIDIDNILGYGPNVVLKTYVRKKFLFPNELQTIIASAPGAIPIGLYIRVLYHSVGAVNNPTIYINYDIEIKG